MSKDHYWSLHTSILISVPRKWCKQCGQCKKISKNLSGGKIESCTYLFTCKAEKLYHISWIGHQDSRLHINKTHCRHSSFTSYENKMGIEDGTKVHLFGVGDIEHTPNESCNLLDYARSPTPPSPLLIEHHKSYCCLKKSSKNIKFRFHLSFISNF